MDAPIYIHHVFFEKSLVVRVKPPAIRNRLYVIEGRDGSAGEEVVKTDRGRIGVYNLPDLDDMFFHSSLFVVGSRLFIVGGRSSYRGAKDAILYLDYSQHNGRWEETALDDFDFDYVAGMAVLDGDRINCFGGTDRNFSFLANDVKPRISSFSPGPGIGFDTWLPISLAVTPDPEQKIYVFWFSGEPYGELGFYLSGKWHTIDAAAIWPRRSTSAVVVKDQYLITFADSHPVTEDYGPELYVCDIKEGRKSQWLAKPVEGLLHDNSALAIFNPDASFGHTSLMRVSALNFALIWSVNGPAYHRPGLSSIPPYQLRCTKFTLSIQDEDTDTPTIRAQLLSSICYNSDDINLCVHSTTGNPSSLQETPSRNLALKRKLQALKSGDEEKVASSEG